MVVPVRVDDLLGMVIHVRILATYPVDAEDPEETFDLTYRLRRGFASTPPEAHARIVRDLATSEVLTFPADDATVPVRFDSHVVQEVWVW